MNILEKDIFSKEDIIYLLKAEGAQRQQLFARSAEVKEKHVQNMVYYRGLVELSNICSKNCFYCGIRKGNTNVKRYNLSDKEVLEAARFAVDANYGSLVIQAGEIEGKAFTERISYLLKEIKKLSDGKLGITLSLGEQTKEVYQEWFNAGAHRYLLRIEASNKDLYQKLHPNDNTHDFERRKQALKDLKSTGYQVGTGVMIGLPFQSYSDLADELLFIQAMDIDMVGMGPYIEHQDTPLYKYRDDLLPLEHRFDLTLKMIAILRIMMKDINMAATTALQAIDKIGREKAIKVGANIMMPNITPGNFRDEYALYENKPCTDENAEDCKNCLEARIHITGHEIGYGKWGDSLHFSAKQK